MRKFKLNKLVRDHVFENMQALGQAVDYQILDGARLMKALQQKLAEEVAEFNPSSKEALKELADVLEVVEALSYLLGAGPDQLRHVQATTRSKRGGFIKHIFVKTITLNETDPWVKYYAAQPDRFPEIPSS